MENLSLLILICMSLSACAQITINPTGPTVDHISLQAPVSSIAVGGRVIFHAFYVMSDQSINDDITSECTWASSDPTKAQMFLNVARGIAVGTPGITCAAGGLISAPFTLTVTSPPQITFPACGTPPCLLPQGANGAFYSTALSCGNTCGVLPDTWSISVGSLPGWAALNASTGVISGTAATGSTNFTIQVCDSVPNCATLAVTLSVVGNAACGPPTYACGSSTKCSSLGVPTWAATDGPATLPTVCFNTLLANTPSPGGIYQKGGVNYIAQSASDLTNILAGTGGFSQIACGQVLQLQAGATFSGHFIFPALACDNAHWITIESSGIASLPPEGTRISPCYAGVTSQPGRPAYACPGTPGNYMAQISAPNGTSAALAFLANTSRVRFIGIEFTRAPGFGPLVEEVTLSNVVADHIIFDRIWCHGDESGGGSGDETRRCFGMSADSYIAAIEGYYNNFYCISGIGSCVDSQAIQDGSNNTNVITETAHKIVNNFMEAGAETYLSGGTKAQTTPSNIEYRINTQFKPLTWDPLDPSYNGGINAHPIIVKNCFELKNAQLLLYEGNTCTNNWGGFTQVGYMIGITPQTQLALCPTCFVKDITVRYGTTTGGGGMVQMVTISQSGTLPAQANNWSVHDMVSDNLFATNCSGCGATFATMSLRESDTGMTLAQHLHDVSFNHNTIVYANSRLGGSDPIALLAISGATIASGFQMSNITFTNNAVWPGRFGTMNPLASSTTNCSNPPATAGAGQINACWSPKSFGGNCFIQNGTIPWPGTNVTSVATFGAAFVSYNNGVGGNYVLSANACQGQGTDGLDPGANIAQVASVIAGN